jgi:hypothetical protein
MKIFIIFAINKNFLKICVWSGVRMCLYIRQTQIKIS